MALGQLVLELKLNGNEFTVGLKSASGQLGQFIAGTQRANQSVTRATESTRKWGNVLRDTVIGLALVRDAVRTLADVTVGWQAAIVKVNGDMERSIALMKNFSTQRDAVKASAEAVGEVNMLLARASTSPFSLTAITDTFVKLRVGGVDPAAKSLNTLVDSVAAFGGSGENLKRAGVAIQQMAGKGVVSMEELRQQLGEAVPTAINAMADGLGTTYAKLVKEISQGKVSSKPAIQAMMEQLELSFKGSAATLMNTWGGAVAQFETGVKKIAVAFGGLEEGGYAEGGYLKTVTAELRSLTGVMNSPEMLNSAREVGKAIAELVTTAANGVKWIIQNKDSIYEWGKALLYLWLAFKGASIIGSVMGAAGAAINKLSMAMIQMRMNGVSAAASLRTQAAAMSGFNNSASIAAGGFARIATGSAAAGTAVRVLGGALGVIAGPIGLIITLAGSLGLAWYESAKGAKAAEQAVLDLNGALTDNNQLKILSDKRNSVKQEYEDQFGKNKGTVTIGQYGSYNTLADYQKAKAAKEAEMKSLDDTFFKARIKVADNYASQEAAAAIQANDAAVGEVSRNYKLNLAEVNKQFNDEAKKSGKKFDEEGYRKAIKQLGMIKLDDEIELYQTAKKEAEAAIEKIAPQGQKTKIDQTQLVQLEAAKKMVDEYKVKIAEATVARDEFGRTSLADTMVNGKDPNGGKPKFDALSIWVDKLAVKYGNLTAKADEANPYLGELAAVVESLDGKKLPNFDAEYAKAQKLAEGYWAAEKAMKAITTAQTEYKNGMSRLDAIQDLVNAKLNKVENLNPWEKASADSIRYEEELTDLTEQLEKTKKAAYEAQVDGRGASFLKKLEEEGVATAAKMEEVRATIEKLKVADTGKKMREDADSITEGLMEPDDKARVQYERQTAWAEEFYRKHQDQLNQDSVALAAYYDYRGSLDAQFQRDTESGLDAWIRQNKDATEEYKSLWGSAMDKFNDTLVEGLTSGKFELSEFVEYVLKEFIKIQLAKQMAAAAEAVGGSGGGGGLLGGLVSMAGSFFGGASGGNGLAAGSAGATSSNLGASSAGYSSKYFANGGIMTEYGELALKKYANGGVARTPQVAIYGEGSGAEAYVPLPDGRTIPVTMSGSSGGEGAAQKTGSVPVEVNVYNQGGEQMAATSNSQFDGEKMVVDIMLKKLQTPGPVRDAVKGVK
ncbi:tail tape measure protein [Pseudomonas phage hairong]|nr:tail tape measure protein [Pseudomonas phage hairong]